jgi:exonuclease SbcC
MKILAIRGKNLASLSAEFCVDFQSEPLASAGLYAITGPTGSGKSTLLDALCLALYERTPRLQKANAKGETIPDVGDNAVSPGDPRTILRRGASEGFAEVDFVGNDALAYRAHWSVRRARVKADGKLQASEMSLLRLHDSQVLGDNKKTETLRLIEACIGLSFEQFTRAVLLAQNDFATFLKAPDDERAELLQTLTGTETFATISRQAYARMKSENEALTRLQEQLQGQQPLAPEERLAKEAALQEQAGSTAQLEGRKAELENHARWYQQAAVHQQDLNTARASYATAVDRHGEAAPRQAELQLLEQVQSARPLWAERERLAHTLATATQLRADIALQLAQAGQELQSEQAAADAAQAQAEGAEFAKVQTQAAIDQARALDASILALTPAFQAAELARDQARNHLEAQTLLQAQSAARISQTQAEWQGVQDWLNQHAALRALSEGWQRWDTLFANAHTALVGHGQSQADASALAGQVEHNTQQLARAQSALVQATALADSAAAQLQAAVQSGAAMDADTLAANKLALEAQRDHLQAAALVWHKRSEVRAQRLKWQAQQQTHTQVLAESQAVLQACRLELPQRSGALQSAEQALAVARLASSGDAESLRAQLQPDAACPVCGALEHPYAEHAPSLNAVLQGLQDHVTQCQQALLQVQERTAFATADQANSAKALEQGRQELAQLAAQRDTLLQEWAALTLQAELEAVPQEGRSAWLQQAQEELRRALAALAAQESLYRQSQKQKEDAQQALNAANQALQQAREGQAQLQVQASQISLRQESTQQQLALQAQQLDRALEQLDGAFVDATWRQRWRADAQAFVAQCRSDAKAWGQQQQSHATLTQTLAGLALQRSAAATACSQANQQLAAQEERLQTAQTSLQGYQSQRAALLQGQSVEAVEIALSAAIARSKATLAAAHSNLQAAAARVTRLQESLRLTTQQLEQQGSALNDAQAALAHWLHSHNAKRQGTVQEGALQPEPLSLDTLQALLARDPLWMAAEREALQALQGAVSTAQAVLHIRQQAQAEHAARKASEASAEALQAQLLAVSTDMLALSSSLSALKLDVARDDERLAASSALRVQIAQQSGTARVWSQLGELIGSADGKKFRNFAQQLTLDILLGYGNRHLQALSRRYRIQRIADSLGLLVVDQDMGDELRSVHSLSGGESFLVSLAMALGLASLSSHRVRVESLFIDEGFGSLDADSLRVAMDALDSLQSLGRKVGVISHVAEMTERIGTQVQVQRLAGGLSRVVVA